MSTEPWHKLLEGFLTDMAERPVRSLEEDGELRSETLKALRAAAVLRSLPRWAPEEEAPGAEPHMSPDEYREFLRNLGRGSIPRGRLRDRVVQAEEAERYLAKEGYRFDRATGRLVGPPRGSKPKFVLTEVVHALLQAREQQEREVRNSSELREWLAAELAPLFGPEELDPAPRRMLWTAVDNYRTQPQRRRRTPKPPPS